MGDKDERLVSASRKSRVVGPGLEGSTEEGLAKKTKAREACTFNLAFVIFKEGIVFVAGLHEK